MPWPDNQRLSGAHARRVDQPPAPGHGDQLRRHGGVATPLVAGAHRRGVLAILTDQRVDERRLAHAAGAEEGDRRSGPDERPQLPEAGVPAPARDDHRHPERDLLQLATRRLGIVDEIGLGEHHHGIGPAVEPEHQLALEPALVGWRRRTSGTGTSRRCWRRACATRRGRPRTTPGARTPSAAGARARRARRRRRRRPSRPRRRRRRCCAPGRRPRPRRRVPATCSNRDRGVTRAPATPATRAPSRPRRSRRPSPGRGERRRRSARTRRYRAGDRAWRPAIAGNRTRSSQTSDASPRGGA